MIYFPFAYQHCVSLRRETGCQAKKLAGKNGRKKNNNNKVIINHGGYNHSDIYALKNGRSWKFIVRNVEMIFKFSECGELFPVLKLPRIFIGKKLSLVVVAVFLA